jgi:hypothetical protein
MRLLKQAMAVLGTVVVIAAVVALVTPKTAHAIVATAVQVVNTSANPVPVASVSIPAVQIVTFTGNEVPNSGTADVHGPFDVSGFSTIRLSAGVSLPTISPFCIVMPNGCSIGAITDTVALIGLDSVGNSYVLDSFTVLGGNSTSRTYQLPGTSVEIAISASCGGACNGSTNFALFGR